MALAADAWLVAGASRLLPVIGLSTRHSTLPAVSRPDRTYSRQFVQAFLILVKVAALLSLVHLLLRLAADDGLWYGTMVMDVGGVVDGWSIADV